jgi:hypothetical protein
MKKSVFLAVSLLALGGCVSHNFEEGERTNYRCAGDKEFSYREVAGALEVFAGGETNRLTRSTDGQWANERVTLSESGGGATLTGAIGGPYENCRRRASNWWFRPW